jgi:hypothetical protein
LQYAPVRRRLTERIVAVRAGFRLLDRVGHPQIEQFTIRIVSMMSSVMALHHVE